MVSIRSLAILISETSLVLSLLVSDSLLMFEFIDLSMACVTLRMFTADDYLLPLFISCILCSFWSFPSFSSGRISCL